MAFKIILKDKYKSYQHAQNILELQSLKDRREELCLTFAKKCLGNGKMKNLFPPNNRIHPMQVRETENFQVFSANTERLKNSSIIYMQKLLNDEVKRKTEQDKLWTS